MEWLEKFPMTYMFLTRENWKIIRGLPRKSLRARVKIDIILHNHTIRRYKKGIQYYVDANTEKYTLLAILDGKITDPKQIRKMIGDLRKCRRSHLYRRSDPDWDKAWVKVYDDWIAHLNGMLGQ